MTAGERNQAHSRLAANRDQGPNQSPGQSPSSGTPLVELVVDFAGCGLKCARCGGGRLVRLYRIAGTPLLLDWWCATIEAAQAAELEAASDAIRFGAGGRRDADHPIRLGRTVVEPQ